MTLDSSEIGEFMGRFLGRAVGFVSVIAVQAWIASYLWEHVAQRLYAQPPIDFQLWALAMWIVRMVARSAVPEPDKP